MSVSGGFMYLTQFSNNEIPAPRITLRERIQTKKENVHSVIPLIQITKKEKNEQNQIMCLTTYA